MPYQIIFSIGDYRNTQAELPFSRSHTRKKDIMRDFILEQYASQQEKIEIYLVDPCLFSGRCLN